MWFIFGVILSSSSKQTMLIIVIYACSPLRKVLGSFRNWFSTKSGNHFIAINDAPVYLAELQDLVYRFASEKLSCQIGIVAQLGVQLSMVCTLRELRRNKLTNCPECRLARAGYRPRDCTGELSPELIVTSVSYLV